MDTMKLSQVSELDPNIALQVEMIWEMAKESLTVNGGSIVITPHIFHSIGLEGLEELKARLSKIHAGSPVIACQDNARENIRIMKYQQAQNQQQFPIRQQKLSTSVPSPFIEEKQNPDQTPTLRAFGRKAKVPRPPNAFILYRQHWHPHFKQYNKSWHNNDISKELGKRWKSEPEAVKAKYKKLAEELKQKHAAQYPNYQYAPRKPGEKKRRMTARKLAMERKFQGEQETSSFPSPQNSPDDTNSPGQTFYSSAEDFLDECSPKAFDRADCPASPSLPIRYQTNDTYTIMLPNSSDNIQAEVDSQMGKYGVDYVDVLHDVRANEKPEEHLLHADPTESFANKQNEWESLIDWEGLNDSIKITECLPLEAEDVLAVQASCPDTSYRYYEELADDWTQYL